MRYFSRYVIPSRRGSIVQKPHLLPPFERTGLRSLSERERYRRRLDEANRRLPSYRSREGGTFAFADELAEKRRQLREVDDALAAAAVEGAEAPAEAACSRRPFRCSAAIA